MLETEYVVRRRRFPWGILVLALLALFIAIGFGRGWFSMTSDAGPDKTNVNLTIDKEKIRDDANKVEAKARSTADKAKDEVHDLTK